MNKTTTIVIITILLVVLLALGVYSVLQISKEKDTNNSANTNSGTNTNTTNTNTTNTTTLDRNKILLKGGNNQTNEVKELQRTLNLRAQAVKPIWIPVAPQITVDGIFGTQTENLLYSLTSVKQTSLNGLQSLFAQQA